MEVEGTTTSVRMLGGLILLDLTHGFQRRKLTLGAHLNSNKVKSKSKSSFSLPSFVARLLHKCKSNPWMGIWKSVAIWSRYTPKWSVKWLKKFKIPLDAV